MAFSGRNGEWLTGRWDLRLPVESIRVWILDGKSVVEVNDWGAVNDRVLAVLVLHPGGRKTCMAHVDEYPDPHGQGKNRLGWQMGDLWSEEWSEAWAQIRSEF